jgi:hypothetical protein
MTLIGTYELVIATIGHRKYDIPLLPFIIEINPYSSSKYDESESSCMRPESKTSDTVYQKSREDISFTDLIRRVDFNDSSGSTTRNAKPVCLAEELFRLIAIISSKKDQYSTHEDVSHWFAETIMETAEAIFQPGLFQRFKSESESNRNIITTYRNHKRKFPTPIGKVSQWQAAQRQAAQLEQDSSTLQAVEVGQSGELDEAGGGGGVEEGGSAPRTSWSVE